MSVADILYEVGTAAGDATDLTTQSSVSQRTLDLSSLIAQLTAHMVHTSSVRKALLEQGRCRVSSEEV